MTPRAPASASVTAEAARADGFATGPRLLRSAFHQHVKGVAVITAGDSDPVGFCATSLAPVSVEPPMLSFSVSKGSSSWAELATAEHVMVHLLADDQEDLARRFGAPGEPRFGPATRWRRGAHGLPVLEDALTWLLLALVSRIDLDDHALVIGRVVAVRESATGSGKGPLLHYSGRYGQLARHAHHCGCPV